MTKANVPTLYEWSGGQERIEALFKKFYEHVRTDSLLGPVFADMPEEHFQTVAHFVSEVLGGPKLYTSGSTTIRPWSRNTCKDI
jgi:hemoglobin